MVAPLLEMKELNNEKIILCIPVMCVGIMRLTIHYEK